MTSKFIDKKSIRPDLSKEVSNNAESSYISAEGLSRALFPPCDNTREVLHGVTVYDLFRLLENLDAPETKEWVRRENQQFSDYIAGAEESKKAATVFLTDAMNYDLFGIPDRYGDKYFRTYKEGLAAQERKEVSSSADGPWKTLLDPNTLSTDGTISLSGWFPSKDGKRVAYFLSESGSSVTTMHILDTETGKNLPDTIENCFAPCVLWDKDSHDSFQYPYSTHDETLHRMVKHHVIGQSIEQDSTVFEAAPEEYSFPSRFDTAKYEWMYITIGRDNAGLSFRPFGSSEPFREIVKPKEFSLSPVAELEDGSVLAVTNKDSPRGRLVSFNPNDPAPEKWQTILPEHDTDVLSNESGTRLHKGKLFAFYKQGTADAIRVFTPDGKHLHDIPIPAQSVVSLGRINDEDPKFSMQISSYKRAGDFYSYDIEKNELTLDKKGPAKYNLDDCIVEHLYATSKDGTKVPMTVIRHPDTKLDGTAAVRLHGYGGFNGGLPIGCSSSMAHFVKSGGIVVRANLRGDGGFGEKWYNEGRLGNKQNVFDDFIACAEHLIEKKYTSPKRLVIWGGSNGGLLTSSVMLQRPELFGAVVSDVPVTDMLRYHLTTSGAGFKADYGDPGKKEDFEWLARYSPLHNVKLNAKYPAFCGTTADHDDCVAPWHAYKLAATLQARSNPNNITLLRVEKNAGHNLGKPTAKVIEEAADVFAFIERAIGPVNQKDYVATLQRDAASAKKAKNMKKGPPKPG
ncbi:MAG: prolyl oligopeptidase family serine peptidase [Pseudomonadota bacterium]